MSASWKRAGEAARRYAAAGAAALGMALLALWPWLEPAGRRALLQAAAVALPIQVAAFWALVRFRAGTRGFLTVWVGGTLVRMAVVACVGWLVLSSGGEGAVVMPLALAGFFFALLLLEPVYFRVRPGETG